MKSRAISFPSFVDVHKPIRSTLDGTYLAPEDGAEDDLVTPLLRLLFTHPVDWVRTSELMTRALMDCLENDSAITIQILSFGPYSSSLLSDIRKRTSDNPRLQVMDLSQSPASYHAIAPDPRDGIAIVGMGVNFPKGNDVDEMWETLKNGLSTVQEVQPPNSSVTRRLLIM